MKNKVDLKTNDIITLKNILIGRKKILESISMNKELEGKELSLIQKRRLKEINNKLEQINKLEYMN